MFYRTNENRNQIETTGIEIKAQNKQQKARKINKKKAKGIKNKKH